jgi:hypothetical protein
MHHEWVGSGFFSCEALEQVGALAAKEEQLCPADRGLININSKLDANNSDRTIHWALQYIDVDSLYIHTFYCTQQA